MANWFPYQHTKWSVLDGSHYISDTCLLHLFYICADISLTPVLHQSEHHAQSMLRIHWLIDWVFVEWRLIADDWRLGSGLLFVDCLLIGHWSAMGCLLASGWSTIWYCWFGRQLTEDCLVLDECLYASDCFVDYRLTGYWMIADHRLAADPMIDLLMFGHRLANEYWLLITGSVMITR